jgi:hypothetical protein
MWSSSASTFSQRRSRRALNPSRRYLRPEARRSDCHLNVTRILISQRFHSDWRDRLVRSPSPTANLGGSTMGKLASTSVFSLAVFALLALGPTVHGSTDSILGEPGTGGGCSSACTVGGQSPYGFLPPGNGGVNSDGKARGFRVKFQATEVFPGATVTNSGNSFAGHLNLSDPFQGTRSGAASPNGGGGGRTTGVFGNCTGRGCLG